MTSSYAAWFPGVAVGRYLLMTPLASGGMAEIWLARQAGPAGFERLVVIKRMAQVLEADPGYVEMFLAEARLGLTLKHPHLVELYELGEDRGSYFIVMEFIDGETLALVWKEALRTDRPLSGPLAAQLIAWAAAGLHHAHTQPGPGGAPQGLVHRDVSPQNLLVTYEGSLKLVDFGIAQHHARPPAPSEEATLQGKLSYMSPEQGRGEPLDARSDLFSLGVVLFELVTRTRLFPKLSDEAVLGHLVRDAAMPRAQERRKDVPDAMDRIIAKALAVRPELRFESARELELALTQWLERSGRRPSPSQVAEVMTGLFPERLEARRKLTELARRSELTASQVPLVRMFPAEVKAPAPAQRTLWRWWLALPVSVAALIGLAELRGEPASKTPAVVVAKPPLAHEAPPQDGAVSLPLPLSPELDAGAGGGEPLDAGSPKLGTLVLESIPRTTVYLGSRRLGITPLRGLRLPVGTHLLRLTNQGLSINQTLSVTISASGTTFKRVRLR